MSKSSDHLPDDVNAAPAIRPVFKRSLADSLAARVQSLIGSGRYAVGERLPSIAQMARDYNVGSPTLREAIKRLEALGLVSVRHGSGVYVRNLAPPIFVTNPIHTGTPSKKMLLDLIEARMPIEVETVGLAARHATPDHLGEMERLLAAAAGEMGNPAVLGPLNMGFHCEIAKASGNGVLAQLVEQMVDLFREEQRVILDIHGPRDRDHREHRELLAVVREQDEGRARELMAAHLGGVQRAIRAWDEADPTHRS